MINILITGSEGFIAKNLLVHLSKLENVSVRTFSRDNDLEDLKSLIKGIHWVFHLAGENRPKDDSEFFVGNVNLTMHLLKAIHENYLETNEKVPFVFSSSTHVKFDTPYGRSKTEAENLIFDYQSKGVITAFIYRLPNVFGKWAKPNYNSVVATFCHNLANNLPLRIDDPDTTLNLLYVDDLIRQFLNVLNGADVRFDEFGCVTVFPPYSITLGRLVEILMEAKKSRSTLVIGDVGTGVTRALYSTYLSYLDKEQFQYSLFEHKDNRGSFVEILKTNNAGQFSFLTAKPGVTRGGHFHHTKSEKFIVLQGIAKFRFENILTKEKYEIEVCPSDCMVIETIPGWSHDITNISDTELIVVLWANEIFDSENPDTYMSTLN